MFEMLNDRCRLCQKLSLCVLQKTTPYSTFSATTMNIFSSLCVHILQRFAPPLLHGSSVILRIISHRMTVLYKNNCIYYSPVGGHAYGHSNTCMNARTHVDYFRTFHPIYTVSELENVNLRMKRVLVKESNQSKVLRLVGLLRAL